MRVGIISALLLFSPALCAAQEEHIKPVREIYISQATLDAADTKPCNAHHRKLKNPFTWLESNMCQEDYDKWVTPRLRDHWYKDKYFWLGAAAIGGSIVLDAHSTASSRRGLVERNPILGANPSNRKIVFVASTDFAIHFGLNVLAWKQSHNDPSQAWRQIGRWGVPASAMAIEGRQGVVNYRLRGRP